MGGLTLTLHLFADGRRDGRGCAVGEEHRNYSGTLPPREAHLDARHPVEVLVDDVLVLPQFLRNLSCGLAELVRRR